MKPFFCRIGNKYPIASQIIDMFPEHETYVEPFVGGGSVFFTKPPSDNEVINDLDSDLITGYKLLKKINNGGMDRALQIAERVDSIKNKTEKLKLLNRIQTLNNKNDNGLKLYQITSNACNTFSSIGKGKLYKGISLIRKMSKINEYKDRLKKTKIHSSDYKNIINKFDTNNTFFFLDPPYEKSDALYKNDTIDYDEMVDLLSNIKGKFLLTINSSPEIKRIFKNFRIKNIKVKGQGPKGSDIGEGIRNELIITNY
jgi:DNA adenine methylase